MPETGSMLAERLGFQPRRVVVLRALRGTGDFLTAIPALRALRAGLPRARIELIGFEPVRALAARFGHLLDGFIDFPGFPGIPDHDFHARSAAFFVLARQADRFDLAIQLQGNGLRTNPFVALLGARRMAGFYLPGQWQPDAELSLPYPGRGREVLRLLALTDHLGLPRAGTQLELPLAEHDRAQARAAQRLHALAEGSYACIAPGASEVYRRWPAERFARVADALAHEGLEPVLVGAEGDRDVAERVKSSLGRRLPDLTGRLSLGGTAALMSDAVVTVTNDSGACHLADAVHAPSVSVFLGASAERWAPLDEELHRVVQRPLPDPNAPYGGRRVEHRCLRDACEYPQLTGYRWPRPDIAAEEVVRETLLLLDTLRPAPEPVLT